MDSTTTMQAMAQNVAGPRFHSRIASVNQASACAAGTARIGRVMASVRGASCEPSDANAGSAFQAAASPRYAARTFGSCSRALASPSSVISPDSIT